MKPVFHNGADAAHPASIEFDGRLYTFSYSAETNVGPKYVPGNDLTWALKESVQNQLDESLHCWGLVGCEATECSVFLTDKGRGVDFDTIFVIGESNKSTEENAVGQHGEGEPLSFLIAVRIGITKIMASKDWLCTARFDQQSRGSKQVAYFDVFKTVSPRTGTAWYYEGSQELPQRAADAYIAFARHHAFSLGKKQGTAYATVQAALIDAGAYMPDRPSFSTKKLLTDEPHEFYSRGLNVGSGPWDLALGYNFQATPGRDRSGFAWDNVKGEAVELWQTQADAEIVAAVFDWARQHGQVPEELRFPQGPDTSILKRGLALYRKTTGIKHVVRATNTTEDSSMVTDAKHMPDVQVIMSYYGDFPLWLQHVVPHVSDVVTVKNLNEINRPLPKAARDAAFYILEACGMLGTPVEGRTMPGNFDGAGDKTRIMLDPAKLKEWTWQRFVEVLVHEAAHVSSNGSSDCTRQHTNAVSTLSAKIMDTIADNPVGYNKAKNAFVKWTLEE